MSDADIAAGRPCDRRAKTARDELFDPPSHPAHPGNRHQSVRRTHVRHRIATAIKGLLATIRGRC